MNVRATQKGYYGGKLREPGEAFAIADKAAFSSEWMEATTPPAAEPAEATGGEPTPAAGKPGRPPKATPPAAEPAET